MRGFLFLILTFLFSTIGVCQTTSLFDKIQTAIIDRNEEAFLALSMPDSQIAQEQKLFIRSVFAFPYQKALITLAEERPDQMILHLFLEARDEARFESWVIHTQKDSDNQPRIRISNTINAITGLYRLTMSDRPFLVRNLKYKHVDAAIHFQEGHIFPIITGLEIAGFFFKGEGWFEFEPKDPVERQQVNLFVKKPALTTRITSLFIRSSPEALQKLLLPLTEQKPDPQPQLYGRAEAEVKDFDRNVYSVRVPFSDELWFTKMDEGELYCEMKTPLGILLYQHSPREEDDILLARKDKDQIISLYNSSADQELQDPTKDFQILSYKMNLRFQPAATLLSGVTEIKLESTQDASSIIFRLNPELRVSQIKSNQGYLIYFQERKTSNLHLVLNEAIKKGDKILLEFYYQGRIAPEKHPLEALQISSEGDFYVPPTYLYSSQSMWYPQLASRPYSGMEASITVPDNYTAIVNGLPAGTDSSNGRRTFSYKCVLPAKYFSLFVGRLDSHLRMESVVPIDVYFLSIDKVAAQEYGEAADRILRFYSGYFGTYPYQNFALVLRPIQRPGGHAPATVAIVNRVFKFFQRKFAKDPLHIPEYPHFLLAHEIAHQWWGQTVGWKTYRDQWLSEGFAQFAAWEYMRNQHGDQVARKLGQIFQEWVEEKTYAGPLILGARLGHITEDPQAFSALLYNKGALILNMLKSWMGNDSFTKCLSEFFEAYQFRRTGIEEFQLIAQKHSEENLDLFFRQWLYGWDLPEIRWKSRAENSQLKMEFEQNQERLYQLKIPVIARSKKGEQHRFVVSVETRKQEVLIDLPFTPASIELDPLHETLMKTKRSL